MCAVCTGHHSSSGNSEIVEEARRQPHAKPKNQKQTTGDSVASSPVAPKCAHETLQLLLKKRKREEPQRRHHSCETSDEVWLGDDGEETDDLKGAA